MILKRFYEDSLAQASFLVGCPMAEEAVIVDPNRDVDVYIDAARTEGMRITKITETHIHADYASGARELAELTGATLYLSGEGGPDWQYALPDMSHVKLVHEGDSFKIGAVRFDVLHTPGHTPEHISFMLTDEATAPEPLAMLTGDFVFVGDVGRPDLLENAAGIVGTMEVGAKDLYKSIGRIKGIPAHVSVWPGHGAGSACGKSLGGVPMSTMGYEALTNWAFKATSEAEFVQEVLEGQPDPPPYFARMKVINRMGPELVHGRALPRVSASGLGDALVLDVRSSDEYLSSHLAGALHIPFDGSFLRWAGWLVSSNDKVVIVATTGQEATRAALKLSLIGIDSTRGWMEPGQGRQAMIRGVHADAIFGDPALTILDVRTDAEWNESHLDRARHVPLNRLPFRLGDLPDGPVAVHCQSGGRSPIASSVLERAGHKGVVCVTDGYPELKACEGKVLHRA